jgi:glutaconate CoA-transferase subunit A
MEITTIEQAVSRYVRDGQTVYLAGFTHLIPFSFGHELIRQGYRGLTVGRATPDLICDQMIAAGVVRRLIFSYAGNPGVGLLRCFRRAVETGDLQLEEYSHFELIARLQAGAAGLPFWPVLTEENDLTRRRGRPSVRSPFGGELVPVVPPLRPDVTMLHAHLADDAGNVYAWGLLGDVREAALAAGKVLVSVEEMRPAVELRRERDHLLLPGFRVDTVSVEPWGAHPSYVQGRYDRDQDFYSEWDRLTRDPEAVAGWLRRFVHGVPDRSRYLDLLEPGLLRSLRQRAAGG